MPWTISLITASVVSFLFYNFVYPVFGDRATILTFAIFAGVLAVGGLYLSK